MTSFIYLNHILNNKHLANTYPITKLCPRFFTNYLLKHTPFKTTYLDDIQSQEAKKIKGLIINFSLNTSEITHLKEQTIIEKINLSLELFKNKPADILGLGGAFCDYPFSSSGKIKLPITNGAFLSAWAIIEALHQTAQFKKINLRETTIAVSGIKGAIGKLCCKKLSYIVKKIILHSGHKEEAAKLKDEILKLNQIEVEIEENNRGFIKDAAVTLLINNYTEENPMHSDDFRKDAIVCVLFPDETTGLLAKYRPDLSVINSGFIKLPFGLAFASKFAAGENIVPASFAETILLALENKLPGKGLTDNQNIEKLEEIADIAAKHGYEIFIPKN